MRTFTIIIEDDGAISVSNAERLSPYDIYRATSEVALNFEHLLIADAVASRVAAMLKPKDDVAEFKQRLMDTLKERKDPDVH